MEKIRKRSHQLFVRIIIFLFFYDSFLFQDITATGGGDPTRGIINSNRMKASYPKSTVDSGMNASMRTQIQDGN